MRPDDAVDGVVWKVQAESARSIRASAIDNTADMIAGGALLSAADAASDAVIRAWDQTWDRPREDR